MPSLLDIRRRIRSVKNTQQLTKAMKTVSAAKLRRAQERVVSARPYAEQLRKVLTNLAARIQDADLTGAKARPVLSIFDCIILFREHRLNEHFTRAKESSASTVR